MGSQKLGGNSFKARAEQMAAARGITFEQFLVAVVKEQGSLAGAAHYLNVNRNTIRYHLSRAGLKPVTRYAVDVHHE